MLTDREIAAAMRDGNPVPEPAHLADDPIGFDILLDKISERRVPMVSAPETRTDETQHAIPAPPRWSRKPLAFAASFIVILMLVGAGALIFRGAGSDIATPTTTAAAPSSTVPSPTTLPPAPTTLPPFPAGEFVTYGPEQDVPDGCGYLMEFGGDGAYLLGECGLLGFDGSSFDFLTTVPLGSLEDLEVGPDGSAWIGQVEVNVQQWTGTELIEHDIESPDLEVGPDGSVWAVPFDSSLGVLGIVRFDGSEWVDAAESGEHAGFDGLAPDGTVWAIVDGSLISSDGTSWTTHETPENTPIDIVGFTPGGAIVLRGHPFDMAPENRLYLIYADPGWDRYELVPPTFDELGLEPTDLPGGETIDALGLSARPVVTEDRSFWFGSSGYGVFSFDGEEWTRFTTADGLASNQITFVEFGPDGSLWFGSWDAGVTRYLPEK